jgi:large subunit ribosomal protein L27
MAHTKAAGSAKRTVDVAGKRLGIKRYAGEYVKPGNIIVRQHGSTFHAGVGTMLGRDYTVFAVNEGFVSFRKMTGYKRNQKLVDVLPTRTEASSNKRAVSGTPAVDKKMQKSLSVAAQAKADAKAEEAKSEPKAKKPATKKAAPKATKKATK